MLLPPHQTLLELQPCWILLAEVMEGSAKLISEAKEALVAPGDAEIQQRLAQVRGERDDVFLFKH